MKHLKNYLAGGAAMGLLLCQQPGAYAVGRTYIDETIKQGGGMTAHLAVAVTVVVLTFVSLAWVVKQGKSGRINVAWGTLAVLLSGLCLLLCIAGSISGTLYTRADGDPVESVTGFFDGILARDYEKAYSFLADYASLGLETVPQTENAALAYEALRASYDYTIAGEAVVDRLEAVVPVRFRSLNMPSFENSVASRTNANLEDIVRSSPVSQVYDEKDQYLPSVTERAYADALSFVLDKADSYYNSVVLDVKLTYADGKWLIRTDEKLLGALMGGTRY